MTYDPSSQTSSHEHSSAVSDELPIRPSLLAPGAKEPSGRGARVARWLLVPLFVILVGLLMVFYVWFSSSKVDGESMEPTLLSGDRMLVTRGYSTPHRGDIIDINQNENGRVTGLVKRVIALAGDTVEIRADVAWVNGVKEPARGQLVQPSYAVDVAAYKVPAGFIYILGDNRAVSEDSRFFGPLPLTNALGKVVALWAPTSRMRRLP